MLGHTNLLLVVLLTLLGSSALAEDAPADLPGPSLDAQIFEFKDGEQVWHRPPEVQFLFLNGCGGGGGGAPSVRVQGPNGKRHWAVGGGGSSAPLETLLIKVTADKYVVRVGAGGKSAARGGPTTLVGSDGVNVSFPGGAAGTSGDGNIGPNGASNSLGTGGSGGAASKNGGHASGACAGGGGGGVAAEGGGQGAPGRLAIVPMPDMARFGRVLAMIEELSRPTKEPEGQSASQQETAADEKAPELPR